MKKIILIFSLLLVPLCLAKHTNKESYYQNIWCSEQKGIMEYILPDKTRVDCLTKDYAVEFDFASKWAESAGQALYYAKMTGKKPAIVLILENAGDEKYYKRADLLAQTYNIKLFKLKSKDYNNYTFSINSIYDLIAIIKGYIKLFLINLIDMI
ncbi:hypothetical protein IJ531_00470 [bacterium]|nr:hypothetical protein [bacterium]